MNRIGLENFFKIKSIGQETGKDLAGVQNSSQFDLEE